MIRYFMFALWWIIFSWFLKLSHFCRTCKRYHKQDSSVVQTVSKDSQQRNQRFQRFYTYREQCYCETQQPSRERGSKKPLPLPGGVYGRHPAPCREGRNYPHETKRRFHAPHPVILPKNGPPTLSKPQKIFQFQKEPFKQLGSMLYLAQERWNQKWTI